MVDINDRFTIGSRVTVASDCDLRGNITLSTGCLLHPRCTVLAVSGPIVIGPGCILEENVVIVNRSKATMTIGSNNFFQVGSRVESPTVGSHNIFGPRSRVAWTVSVGSHCNIGPGCTVLPNPFGTAFVGASRGAVSGGDEGKTDVLDSAQTDVDTTSTDAVEGSSDVPPPPPPTVERTESLPDYTVVFGSENRRRIWTGEGEAQAAALHTKHLEYLREAIPKYHKLKLFPASTPL